MQKLMSSCTAMLVGKNATIDGSTIIARDEDAEDGVNPKTFKVFPAKDYTGEHYVSKYNGFPVLTVTNMPVEIIKGDGSVKELVYFSIACVALYYLSRYEWDQGMKNYYSAN